MVEFYKRYTLKMMLDFKEIRERGLLLYEYIRGSKLYGTSIEGSDEDRGGVFIEPLDMIMGYEKCPETVLDETQDTCWYSLGKYLELISKSNPVILESLFVPEDKVIYKHPLMDIILSCRDEFISKECFKSFIGYAKNQLQKARNLKKKIVCPPGDKKKSILEFYFYGTDEGKTKLVKDWLEERGMNQKFVGLTKMDRMKGVYSAFYDWGGHLKELGIDTLVKFLESCKDRNNLLIWSLQNHCNWDKPERIWNTYKIPFHYRGIVNEQDTTNQLRFSSIPKGEKRILEVSYDQDEYQKYCKVYREWNDFKKHHNPERFNLAKENQIDRKNATHSVRLFEMGIEIAKGEGVILDRSGRDKEFLLSIRRGETDYPKIMKYLEARESTMKEVMEKSTIRETIDLGLLEKISQDIRKKFYGIH